MLYLSIFLLLIVFSVREVIVRKPNRNAFIVIYCILTLFLVLRQGQGTDYFSYKRIYEYIRGLEYTSYVQSFLVTDPGYALLNIFAIKLGMSHKLFMSLFSLATMMVAWKFFYKYCNCSITALLVFFPIGYLTYFFGIIRQGFALAVLLNLLPGALFEKKWIKYCLGVVLAGTIHLSVVVCLLIPLVYKVKISRVAALCIVVASIVLAVFGPSLFVRILPSFMSSRVLYYGESANLKLYAVALRVVDILPIFFVDFKIFKKEPAIGYLSRILLLGFVLYALCSFNELVASRINYYFRVFEVMYVAELIRCLRLRAAYLSAAFVYVILSVFLYVKNIGSYIEQGKYVDCNVITYPYFSVFESEEKILEYRDPII